MSHEKQHSDQHEALLKKQALEQQEVKEVLVFIQKYGKPASTLLLIICILVLGSRLVKANQMKKAAKADAALMMAQSPEALQAVYNDYASTPAGPFALMNLAKMKFNSGEIDAAEKHFNTFLQEYGKHSLTTQAKLNLISCLEAKGQLADAQAQYGAFAEEYSSDAFLAPSAMMSKARCMEALEQTEEARIVYEDIIVNYPDSSWAQRAQAKLDSAQ